MVGGSMLKWLLKFNIILFIGLLIGCEPTDTNVNEELIPRTEAPIDLDDLSEEDRTEESIDDTKNETITEALVPESVVEPVEYQVRLWQNSFDVFDEVLVFEGDSIDFPEITNHGYFLDSWYTMIDGQRRRVESLENINQNMDVYPYWVPIKEVLSLTKDEFLADNEVCKIGVPPEKNLYKSVNTDDLFDYEPLSAGFPISDFRLPSSGIVNAKVLMIDFPDYPGMMTQVEIISYLYSMYLDPAAEYYEIQSNGKLRIEWDIVPGYLRLNSEFSDLNLIGSRDNTGAVREDMDTVVIEAMKLADEFVDFGETSMVLMFVDPELTELFDRMSGASFSLPGNDPYITNDGSIYNFQFIPKDPYVDKVDYGFIHSIGHHLGLPDLYFSNWENDYLDQLNFVGVFDLMNYANTRDFGNNLELFGWSKYLLGWIEDSQIRCIPSDIPSVTTHYLIPNHSSSDEDKLIVIPLAEYKALVIEVKDKNVYCEECSGGIYTYLVNSEEGSGSGQMILLSPTNSEDRFLRDAYLDIDESISYGDITITYIQEVLEYPVIQVEVK
jgi:hypothetical protein